MHCHSTILILAAAALWAAPAAAQLRGTTTDPSATLRPLPPVPQPESQLTVFSGYYSASDGYADRIVAGGFYDHYSGARAFMPTSSMSIARSMPLTARLACRTGSTAWAGSR